MMKFAATAVLALSILLSFRGPAEAASGVIVQEQNSAIIIPAAPDAPAQVDAQSDSRYGLGKQKLPPPKPAACITDEAMNEALLGSGCDCSCEGYAQGPNLTCMTACGLAYYACWAPDPTAAEVKAEREAIFADYDPSIRELMKKEFDAALTSDAVAAADQVGLLMLSRAQRWADDQRCATAGE